MYAITGVTGKVGGALARALLASRAPARAVVRTEQKGAQWRARGCEVAIALLIDHRCQCYARQSSIPAR